MSAGCTTTSICEFVTTLRRQHALTTVTALACSFADRDMFMRYAGGGVGHHVFKVEEEPLQAGADEQVEDGDGEDVFNDILVSGKVCLPVARRYLMDRWI